jgi:hypothetical protein
MIYIFTYLQPMDKQYVFLKILQALINCFGIMYHVFMLSLGIALVQQPENYFSLAGCVILTYDIYIILYNQYESTINNSNNDTAE